MGIIRSSGIPRIRASFGDIQNIIPKDVANVIVILIIEVEESDTMSSSCATSADNTAIRLPVCLVSKYDASIAIRLAVASILMSCWTLYAVDCHRNSLMPWKMARKMNEIRISTPNPISGEFRLLELTKDSIEELV